MAPPAPTPTGWIANRANELLVDGAWRNVPRVPIDEALKSELVIRHDYRELYVADLANVLTWRPSARPACASVQTR